MTNYTFSIQVYNSGIIRDISNGRSLLEIAQCLRNRAMLEVYGHMIKGESSLTFTKEVGVINKSASQNIRDNEAGENV